LLPAFAIATEIAIPRSTGRAIFMGVLVAFGPWVHGAVISALIVVIITFRRHWSWAICAVLLSWYPLAVVLGVFSEHWLASMAVLAFGPAVVPVAFADIVSRAWMAAILPLALGAAGAFVAIRKIRLAPALSALLFETVFFFAAWAVAEAEMETLLRLNAVAAADGLYCLRRQSTLGVAITGLRTEFRTPHAMLYDDANAFHWSFANMRFEADYRDPVIRKAHCLRSRKFDLVWS
jgi:hypothetical protein